MTKQDELLAQANELPAELVWEGAHLSEVAITALSDGEEAIIPADAHTHLAGCDACTRAVGTAAMLSTSLGKALREMPERKSIRTPAPAAIPTRAETRLPWRAVLAALSFAVLGAIPMMMRAGTFLGYVRFIVSHGAPILVRAAAAAMQSLGGPQQVIATMTVASAFVLVCAASLVARKGLLATSTGKDEGTEGVTR